MAFNDNYQMVINFNPAIFRVLLNYLKPEDKEKILEIGCGRGYYLKEIENYSQNKDIDIDIIGIDKSEKAIKKAITTKVKYGDATVLNFEANTFNKIYSLHTIEHIPDLNNFFSEINRVLKPGGISILIYPWEPIRGIQAIGTALIRYKNPFKFRDIHLHKLNPQKIENFIKKTQLLHIKSRIIFAFGIHYITILKKCYG